MVGATVQTAGTMTMLPCQSRGARGNTQATRNSGEGQAESSTLGGGGRVHLEELCLRIVDPGRQMIIGPATQAIDWERANARSAVFDTEGAMQEPRAD